MSRVPHICICGAGNVGTACAAVTASRGAAVSLLTSRTYLSGNSVTAIDPAGRKFTGQLQRVSFKACDIVPEADIVMLCVPGFAIESTLKAIAPHLGPETIVGSVVSSTGFFDAARRLLAEGTPLLGLQRVPYIARLTDRAGEVRILGYKPLLRMATVNVSYPKATGTTLARLLNTPVELLQSPYEASLTNSNPILHTARLYTMLSTGLAIPSDKEPPLFYADWDDEASRLALEMDGELMRLTERLGISRRSIPSLLEYYESTDAPSLTAKLRSIPAFKALKSPLKQSRDGWTADLSSRYFTEDFAYGLRLIIETARTHGVATPVMDAVMKWAADKYAL